MMWGKRRSLSWRVYGHVCAFSCFHLHEPKYFIVFRQTTRLKLHRFVTLHSHGYSSNGRARGPRLPPMPHPHEILLNVGLIGHLGWKFSDYNVGYVKNGIVEHMTDKKPTKFSPWPTALRRPVARVRRCPGKMLEPPCTHHATLPPRW